ncbi:MAG: LysE family translocator [Syntrophobacteraceae bacterium]
MIDLLITGLILGFSAGISPGPILALVITETLTHGVQSGIKVAFAPVFTDAPIIAATFFLLVKLSGFKNILGLISLIGGFFLLFMAYESIRTKNLSPISDGGRPKSLIKGIFANLLNPNPYLFWISVGCPLMLKSMSKGVIGPLLFIGGFYFSLIGSKVSLAMLVARSRGFLGGTGYRYALRFMGLALAGLAVVLFWDGFKLISG